jgi:hypothetical protein
MWIKQAGAHTRQAQSQNYITPAALKAEDKFLRDGKLKISFNGPLLVVSSVDFTTDNKLRTTNVI